MIDGNITLHEIKYIVNICKEAGEAVLDIYNSSEFEIEEKLDGSPITRADKKSHDIISKGLSSLGIPLLSEEGKNIESIERSEWNYFWMIDPIDGTKEFIKKNGDFTINIALINDNKAIFGIVYVPVSETVYIGSKNIGSYKFNINSNNWHKKSNRLPFNHKREFTVVASRSHLSKETAEFIEDLKLEHPKMKIISRGSSLKLCMIAEGVADIYPRFAPTMEWDTAAGDAVCTYAGKAVYEFGRDTKVIYNKQNLLNPWFIVK